jgi:hypothetical protein
MTITAERKQRFKVEVAPSIGAAVFIFPHMPISDKCLCFPISSAGSSGFPRVNRGHARADES